MASIQRIFPRLNTAALSFIRRPPGGFGLWDQTSAVYSAQGARYVGPSQGTAQTQAVPSFSAIPNGATHALLIVQVLSDPLRQTFIAAGDWNVGFAAQLANAGAMFTWRGKAGLYVVNGLTGERRATIFETTNIGSGARTVTTERTCFATIAGQGVQVRTADFLCLELGIAVTNGAAALAPQASIFAEGATPITVDNAATASALTALESPQELLLSLPQAGEPPTASVDHADAVALVKEAWPPDSDTLYDWDNPEAHAHKLFEAFGDFIKLYGYDQSDRLFREINPLTMVELIPVWEAALGITLSDTALRIRSVDQRRQAVIARLREVGPLTLFNVAAIFGQLAGYVAGTTPELFELGRTAQKAANEYVQAVGVAVPTGTTFDATNLIRITPTLLDGGIVWDAGALVVLTFNAALTERLHIQLTGPDFTVAAWTGGPNLEETIYLRSPVHARRPVHGNWVLNIYREVGAPAVTLLEWRLYTLGRHWGGRGQGKFIWSVYLDPAHQEVDRRDIDGTLNRITQSYAQGFVIYDKTSIPGSLNHRPGRFIPGSP
ncbi:MAG: DUF2313 domain-containing protein [Desulfurellales bacterium]|nr:MAG: DUF2313 domain-containing protein [Desulfurellales bacterium]